MDYQCADPMVGVPDNDRMPAVDHGTSNVPEIGGFDLGCSEILKRYPLDRQDFIGLFQHRNNYFARQGSRTTDGHRSGLLGAADNPSHVPDTAE